MSGSLRKLAELVDLLETPMRSKESAMEWITNERRIMRRVLSGQSKRNDPQRFWNQSRFDSNSLS